MLPLLPWLPLEAEPIPRTRAEENTAHPGMRAGAPEEELMLPTVTASPGEPGTHCTAVEGTVASSKLSVPPFWVLSLGERESSRGPVCPLPQGVPGFTQTILTTLPGSHCQVKHTQCQPELSSVSSLSCIPGKDFPTSPHVRINGWCP